MESLSESQGRVFAPSTLLNMILTKNNYAYNPITCLKGTTLPLNDQINIGMGIISIINTDDKRYSSNSKTKEPLN